MRDAAEVIDRREAVRRAVVLIGGSLAAPAALGALVRAAEAQASDGAWAPRTLTAEQLEQVATIGERIIPATDTPGARGAGVHRFVDTMLTEYYTPEERRRFLAGLAAIDAHARREHARSFLSSSATQQHALLAQVDREAFPVTRQTAAATTASKETERGGGGLGGGTADRPEADPSTSDQHFFFRTMKELTVVGYYTSQPGVTKELKYVQVPGRFEGCVPLAKVGRSWAT
jgi:glucoside 3-dehydrogenase (cytochrome c) hitch-hiker subunit